MGKEISRELSFRECQVLKRLALADGAFVAKRDLPDSSGPTILNKMCRSGIVERGFIEKAAGWRITDNGWLCLYGAARDQIIASNRMPEPLRMMRWPP